MTHRLKIAAFLVRLRRKMIGEQLPIESIAGGWALGMFIGCAIPFGLQLVVSVPLSIMMRVSKLGATLGTFVTNPVTIWFIYPAQTILVDRIFFDGNLSYAKLRDMEWSWSMVCDLGGEVMFSFFVGGILLGMVLSPATYFIVKRTVERHRRRKLRKVMV